MSESGSDGSIVIVQSGFLGDAVLASGMLRTLAARRPGTRVGIVVRAEFAGLFAGHPAVARVHPFRKRDRSGTADLTAELAAGNYGTALTPHRSFRSSWILRRAGVPRRVGFRQSDAPWLLTDKVEYDILAHETDRNAALLGRIGVESGADERRTWLLPDPEAVERMSRRFGGDAPLYVIAPGSVWPTKQWRVEGYAGTARRLRESGARVVLTGSPGERGLCERIASLAEVPERDMAAGDLPLVDLVALLSIAERVITNDSAPLHIAESVGTPVTAVFGPTVPEFGFGPVGERSAVVETTGLSCRPCGIHGARSCPIGTHRCMNEISVEQLLATLGIS